MELPKFKPEWKQGRRCDNRLCSIRKRYLLCNVTAWLKDKIEGTKFALPALYQPSSLVSLEIWKTPHLQQTGMSKHTGMSTVIQTAWVSLYWEGSCEDFTTTRISPLAWRFLIHSGSTTVTVYLPMLIVRNEPSIGDASTSYTVYRTPTQFVLSEICATPGWRSTGRGYGCGISSA